MFALLLSQMRAWTVRFREEELSAGCELGIFLKTVFFLGVAPGCANGRDCRYEKAAISA
jgi:hypothetical protein